MGRSHSEETKAKISAAMKQVHAAKREKSSPTAQRVEVLAQMFAAGTHDHQPPAKVRNYGGLGRDVAVIDPGEKSDAALPTHEEKVEAANTISEALGLRRAGEFKEEVEGKRGGRRGEAVSVYDPMSANVSSDIGRR